jgi:hypothetical protein
MDFALSLNDSKFCQVDGCTSNKSHVTVDHKCMTCGEHGHGINEHSYDMFHNKRNRLLLYYDDTMPVSLCCTVPNCDKYTLHTTEYHSK